MILSKSQVSGCLFNFNKLSLQKFLGGLNVLISLSKTRLYSVISIWSSISPESNRL